VSSDFLAKLLSDIAVLVVNHVSESLGNGLHQNFPLGIELRPEPTSPAASCSACCRRTLMLSVSR
jgi:hypothetical protein